MASVPNPVLIRHASAPGEEHEVDASTVDHWRTLGWSVVGETSHTASVRRKRAERAAAETPDPMTPAVPVDAVATDSLESEK